MGKKNLNFSSYDKIRKMTFNEFNRWVTALYIDAFREGQAEQLKAEHNISFDDELPEILLSVKGLGEKRVADILKAIDNHYKKKVDAQNGTKTE